MMLTTGIKSIDNLPAKHRTKIAEVSDERSNNEGFWIYLKGFINPVLECHTIHEPTISECIKQLRAAIPCDCENCIA